jgi:hypothetical protein
VAFFALWRVLRLFLDKHSPFRQAGVKLGNPIGS